MPFAAQCRDHGCRLAQQMENSHDRATTPDPRVPDDHCSDPGRMQLPNDAVRRAADGYPHTVQQPIEPLLPR
jgi:hypothetical protein